jgi:uncharacterized membrane protein
MEEQKEKSGDRYLLTIALITIVVVIIICALIYISMKDKTTAEQTAFGNIFGGINVIFSGFALAGVILTILLQRNELALQRQELRETKEELKRSAIAQEKSERALFRQAENLKISAKLSALNTLVNYYLDEETKHSRIFPRPDEYLSSQNKRTNYISRIEQILESKENN